MAGTPWFKFYDEFLDDPKMLSLSDGMVTLWVRMLCLANRSDERGVIRHIRCQGLQGHYIQRKSSYQRLWSCLQAHNSI